MGATARLMIEYLRISIYYRQNLMSIACIAGSSWGFHPNWMGELLVCWNNRNDIKRLRSISSGLRPDFLRPPEKIYSEGRTEGLEKMMGYR
jgi:hypothetical protein